MTKEQRAEYEKKLKEQEEAMAKDKALQDAFNTGMEAKNAKNYPVAVENLEKACTMAPTQHVVWAQLAESYISLSDTKSGAEQQAAVDKGIAAYAKAVEIKVDDPNYHNNYALALAKGKKMDQAQAELTKAAQLDPPQAGKYYYNLGAVYVNTQQNDAAEAAFKKAIELDPNYADAYYQVGLVLMDKVTLDKDGKMLAPPGTVEALQKYLALKPDGSNAEAAKAILEQLGTTVQTSFERPGDEGQAARQQSKEIEVARCHAGAPLPGRRGYYSDPAAIGVGGYRQGIRGCASSSRSSSGGAAARQTEPSLKLTISQEGSGVRNLRVGGDGHAENQGRRDVLLLFGGVPG